MKTKNTGNYDIFRVTNEHIRGRCKMDHFYCVKCERLLKVSEASNVFRTAWIRIDERDNPMGLCQNHKVTLPPLPPLEIKNTE